MEIGELLYHYAVSNGAEIVRFIDITCLPEQITKGYQNAILIGKLLSTGYMKKLKTESGTDYGEFAKKEKETDKIADEIANLLVEKGYTAYSQSEENLLRNGDYDEKTKRTPLPHKTIAMLSGLGWVGKDNLFVTEDYGSAICMCTVLTNAPVHTSNAKMFTSRCKESCRTCITICPSKCISGKQWSLSSDRNELVDVFTCGQCLKCLAFCPYTVRYTKRISYRPLRNTEGLKLIDFLYEAIYQPDIEESKKIKRNDILLNPSLFHYIRNFGRSTDHCIVASKEDQAIAAVWTRLFSKSDPGYGFVDEKTPELAMSVFPAYRNKGIGTHLLSKMLRLLAMIGYQQVSLSVQKDNFALKMYEKSGFTVYREIEEEYIMMCKLESLSY